MAFCKSVCQASCVYLEVRMLMAALPAMHWTIAPVILSTIKGVDLQRHNCLRPVTRSVGGASAAGGAMAATPSTGPGSDFVPLLRQNLSKLVATNKLEAFYPPQRVEEVLARLTQVDFRC